MILSKLSSILALVILAASQVAAQASLPNCGGRIRIRYEWRDLPRNEQQRYLNAVVRLHRERNNFERFTQQHRRFFTQWHGSGMFLPAHRALLNEFEEALRQVDPDVVVPYWDEGLDASNALNAVIWRDFGTVTRGTCVTDGAFANWPLRIPNPHCLTRNSTGVDATLDTVDQVNRLIVTAPNYAAFRDEMENVIHTRLHILVGGPEGTGDMVYDFSPNDPIFMQHHAYVDKVWNNYQLFAPNRFNEYNGNVNANIPGYNYRVRDVFDTRNLCFVYAEPGTAYRGNYVDGPSSTTTMIVTSSTRVATSSTRAATSSTRIGTSSTRVATSTTGVATSSTRVATSSIRSSSLGSSTRVTTSSLAPSSTRTSAGISTTSSSGRTSSLAPGSSSVTRTSVVPTATLSSTGRLSSTTRAGGSTMVYSVITNYVASTRTYYTSVNYSTRIGPTVYVNYSESWDNSISYHPHVTTSFYYVPIQTSSVGYVTPSPSTRGPSSTAAPTGTSVVGTSSTVLPTIVTSGTVIYPTQSSALSTNAPNTTVVYPTQSSQLSTNAPTTTVIYPTQTSNMSSIYPNATSSVQGTSTGLPVPTYFPEVYDFQFKPEKIYKPVVVGSTTTYVAPTVAPTFAPVPERKVDVHEVHFANTSPEQPLVQVNPGKEYGNTSVSAASSTVVFSSAAVISFIMALFM